MGVGKKLVVLLCVLLSVVACARTSPGRAVGQDAWHGQGLAAGGSTGGQAPSSSPAAIPTATPSSFDPCVLEDLQLSIYAGVDPATKEPLPGVDGCSWTGQSGRFSVGYSEGVDRTRLATTPGVTELSEFEADGQMVDNFVFEGNRCISLAEIDGRTVQFTLAETDFDSFCIRLKVATTLILEDI
ncbi:hypothetical protein [Rhodococcus sp. 14-2470-1a]|uniref:hypothetical protein n=1 Tax=Rhodococcus sp. 14-2470-1a TaxID=2023150 RepID=UPI00211AA6A8|nr:MULTISPECIES: hypothetical protein [unclassified Rhodococcus (in: high G+C Gram-positive bacteria)]